MTVEITLGHIKQSMTRARRIDDVRHHGFEVSVRGWYCTVKRRK